MFSEIKRKNDAKITKPKSGTSFPRSGPIDVDQRQSTSKVRNFFKSITNSGVVNAGKKLQNTANKIVVTAKVKSIQEIASEMMEFIPADKYAEINPLMNRLVFCAVPTTLVELDAYVETAHELYNSVSYTFADKSSKGDEYRNKVDIWRKEFQTELYTLRDELISSEEGSLLHYGLENQYRKLHPDLPVPSLLTERQGQLGVVLFGGTVGNDCGKFAQKILEELEAKLTSSLLERINSNSITDEELREEFKRLIENGPRKDQINYKFAENDPYDYHVKTSLGKQGGKIYTNEANVGKPFLLAAELIEYDSMAAYRESEAGNFKNTFTGGFINDLGGNDIATMDIKIIKAMIQRRHLSHPTNIGRR